jgi:Ni,Fe-hydrogenase III small subunit
MRPLRVFLLDTGGCGACAAEVWATIEPMPELAWAPGPGQADIVVITGSVPPICHEVVSTLHQQFWRGRVPVVAVGRCATDGYPFGTGGVRALKEVEVAGRIDVCPPLPEVILELLQTVFNARGVIR